VATQSGGDGVVNVPKRVIEVSQLLLACFRCDLDQ
jgi:hypothetical protein